jgi:clathrin heavy chain
VLLENLNDVDRALEYATRVNEKDVWSLLAKAQLDAGLVKESIDSYIKAADSGAYPAVIAAAEAAGKFDDLVRFLEMARKVSPTALVNLVLTCLTCLPVLGALADAQGEGDRLSASLRAGADEAAH